jgi:hypothetical protein
MLGDEFVQIYLSIDIMEVRIVRKPCKNCHQILEPIQYFKKFVNWVATQ